MAKNRKSPPEGRLDPLLTVKEAAAFLRRSEWQVYRDIASGRIPHVKMLGSVRFTRAGLLEWVASQQHDATTSVR